VVVDPNEPTVDSVQASEILHVRPRLLARRSHRQQQEAADRWIGRGDDDPVYSPVAWRVQELISPRERIRLARSVRGVLKALSAKRLPGASPLNRAALRPYAPLLAALADRLSNLEHPVRAAGVLAVRRLLTDPDGPLYARTDGDGRGDEVGGALRAVLRKLDR
jgi:hypothetical protein